MDSNKFVAAFNGVRFRKPNAVAIAAALAMLTGAKSQAALVFPVTPAAVPVTTPISVFDVTSNPGNSYALSPGTTLNPLGFDVRDLFGGSFGTNGYEPNDVIFADNQPIGTVDSVSVTLAAPVSLSSFNLYLQDDGNGNRSASEFLLLEGTTVIDDVHILDGTGTQSYTSAYGNNTIEISDSFNGLPASTDYTLELVQNQDANGSSGIRALDFTATGNGSGTGFPGTSVPEPGMAGTIALASAGLLSRRKVRV